MKSSNPFENPFGDIFSQAYAQGIDTLSAPTLPVDPNLKGPLFDGPVPGEGKPKDSTIKLSLKDAKKVNKGDTFTVNVEVLTDKNKVGVMEINIEFNPNKVSFQSKKFLDTYFTREQSITVDKSAGTIKISAKATGENATVNRIVSSLQFKAISDGKIEIGILKDQSFLYDEGTNNILKITENLSFDVGAEITTNHTTNNSPHSLPKSDFSSLNQYSPYVAGAVFLTVGLYLLKVSKSKKEYDL